MTRFLNTLLAFVVTGSTLATTAEPTNSFRGCLQGDAKKGFALLSPTTNTDGSTGQMKTYRVVPAKDKNIDLVPLANKVVEITGPLATSKAGVVPETDALGARKIDDSGRTTPTSPAAGTQMWSEGTLTALSVRQLENSCGTGSNKAQ